MKIKSKREKRFITERREVNGIKEKRCSGYNGKPCPDNAWIKDESAKMTKCPACKREYTRGYERLSRELQKIRSEKEKPVAFENAIFRGCFSDCTEEEETALRSGDVEALLKCSEKKRTIKIKGIYVEV